MSKHWKASTSRLETAQSAGVPLTDLGETSRLLGAHLDYDPKYNQPLVLPIYQSSTYRISDVDEYLNMIQQGGFIYQRLLNPNGMDAECRIRTLEGGAGTLVFNTGMSCMTTILTALLKSGDHVVCQNPIYSAVHYYVSKVMSKFGIEYSWVRAGSDVSEFEKAIKSNTRMIIGETPGNPLLNILDLEAFGALGQKHNVLTIVDCTYATPCTIQPIRYGIDIVWHSGTKYMSGHSDSMAGVLTARSEKIFSELLVHRAHSGTNIAPSEAALLTRGLATLPTRMAIHNSNGVACAKYLEAHPKVSKVYYPGLESNSGYAIAAKQMSGFGGMVSFEMAGGYEAAKQMVTSVKLINLAVSLGGVESLIEHPASMTHGPMIMSDAERAESLITQGQIRFSVGIEDIKDLLRDLENALDAVTATTEE